MRILLFNEYYPPDTSATAKMAALVAEHLAKRHDVTVVAGRPSYDPTEYYPFAFLRRDIQNGVTVERVGSSAYPRHKMKRRVANYLSYLALAVPRAIALPADVILAMTDPPIAGIAGAFVSRMSGKPLVYNIRDLYPDMAVGGDIVRPSEWVRWWEKMHRGALRRAKRVIVLGDDMRNRILAKGIAPDRVAIVRDGATLPSSAPDRSDPVVKELRCGFPFVVAHAGNLGFYGAWATLIGAARILQDENVGFVFVGDGANRAAIESSAKGLRNVRFMPFRPAEQIPHVMMAGDVHVVTVKRGLEGVVVPSKLYSILAAGRPVLALAPVECDAASIVSGSQCGVVVDPDDSDALAQSIRALRDNPTRLAMMASRARDVASDYIRVNELERFTGIVEEAAGKT
ncbi:MAG TPA: glycosyltransferase family 4 protein [Candidatus Acidoferrales bacterium]